MLSSIKMKYPSLITKTGFMVGLGETSRDVEMTLKQVQSVGVSIVTIGQYLPPSKSHYPVKEYLDPERFEAYKQMGLELGLEYVFAGPLVRSSYTADLLLKQYQEQKQ
jgi:lipoyl synthase